MMQLHMWLLGPYLIFWMISFSKITIFEKEIIQKMYVCEVYTRRSSKEWSLKKIFLGRKRKSRRRRKKRWRREKEEKKEDDQEDEETA